MHQMKTLLALFLVCTLATGCKSPNDDGRAPLKLALGLATLPQSVRNVRYGEDAWTDYIVHVYCEVAPKDFAALLAGREFIKREPDTDSFRINPPDYARTIPGFTAVEVYHWHGAR